MPLLVSYPDPDSQQLRMDYITATWKVGLVSSCTNFCPAPPECWGDQSDLRYALIAYCSYQSKLLIMAARLEMDDVQVKRAIQSAGERMGFAKVKDEQFRVVKDVVRGQDTFVSLPAGYGKSLVTAFCYGYKFDELSVREVRSKPLTIAPKSQRARNDATADPHLRRAAQAARRLSPATPTHVRRSSSGARGPTTPGRGRAASSTPSSAFTTMSLPLEARSQEG